MASSDPILLSFDTSAAHCAAALLCGGRLLASRFEEMGRGQAERLMPMIEEMMTGEGLGFGELAAIAVGIGPGNFTGIRISVSAARGLGLALGCPVFGISGFEALRGMELRTDPAPQLVSLPGPRARAYVQLFENAVPSGAPLLIDPSDPPRDLSLPEGSAVLGYEAQQIARALDTAARDAVLTDPSETLARLAEVRLLAGERPERPAPLYIRPADAAPASDPPPVILDDA
ncbi:tRNA (adenosine(37)-N6)-threonylcarbamoyltransferase complex dimerization subunit type 1 TsaB [Litorisediminicola beolgyonensis]|uniref:tRNA (Adenosine(37)-N6)-threonylcarbamoyltransferase complex dimerization subunit type 1 TsaB n=1 Tax=Litorisediminicola beolgyonensis TaxID=1173614 RepID=A0ABW3ZFU7_9RHOB